MRAKKADPFDVWGKPPPLLRTLTKRQQDSLRRYVTKVAKNVYRLAYDLGAASKNKRES
jgi:hypothetical protein